MPLEWNWDEELEFIRGLLRPEWNCVQAGANLGVFPIAMSRVARNVFCIEPQRPTFEVLLRNIAESGQTNIQAFHGAFGAEDGEIYCPDVEVGRTDVGLRCDPKVGYRVPLVRIDTFLWGTPVHFIQLDVEGMELEALEGAPQAIRRHRPVLYVENNFPEAVAEFASANHYEVSPAPNLNVVLRPCPA